MSVLKVNQILDETGSSTTPPSIPALETRFCKAWVNFNGVGTVAIRDSHNVSSITDGGVGMYTINFAVALANANYSTTCSMGMIAQATVVILGTVSAVAATTTGRKFSVNSFSSGAAVDSPEICVQIFGGA